MSRTEGVEAAASPRPLSPPIPEGILPAPPDARSRSEVRQAVGRFLLVELLLLLIVAVPIAFWIRVVAEKHALDNALLITHRLVEYAVEPVLTDEALAGARASTEQLDAQIEPWLEDGTIRRIKIWEPDGTVLYSDEETLIGKKFPLPDWDREEVQRGTGSATLENQRGLENMFEAHAGELIEVYVGFVSPMGEPLVFEAYYDGTVVRDEQRSVLMSMGPLFLAALALFQLAQVAPAVRLARRIQSYQTARAQQLQRTLDAAEHERMRVARDLHDDVIQDLAGLSFVMEAQERHAQPDQRARLAQARSILQNSLRSMRKITSSLYTPDLLELGLAAGLERLTDSLSARGVATTVRVDPGISLCPEQEGMFLRVAREALANTAKHADASSVDVKLKQGPSGVILSISDDGEGFDTSTGSPDGHLGLRIMHDITSAAEATLAISSRPGGGTTVVAYLPFPRDGSRR